MMGALDDMMLSGIKKEHAPSIARFSWRVILFVFVSWSLGLYAGLGFDGFARAGEVHNVSDDLKGVRIELLESRLFETRVKQCAATSTEARQFYRDKLQSMLQKYQQITGQLYALPSCSEL